MLKKLCLLLLLVLTVGACSSSTPAANGTDTPTDSPSTTEPDTDGDVDAFCAQGNATFGAGNPFQGFDRTSPETLRTGFQAAVNAFTDLLDVSPADVRLTIEDGVAAMVEIEASLDAVDYDFSRLTEEDTQRFSSLANEFDFEAFAAAAAQHCS